MIHIQLSFSGASIWHHAASLANFYCSALLVRHVTASQNASKSLLGLAQFHAFFHKLFGFLVLINFSSSDRKKGSTGMMIQEKLQNRICAKENSHKATLATEKEPKAWLNWTWDSHNSSLPEAQANFSIT